MSTKEPPVSVIILNWNGRRLLQEYLPQVISNTNPQLARIIVADNGSTDGSQDLLRTEFPDVTLMEFDTNHGFAGGYNLAMRNITSPYAILLNSDVAPEAGWIDPLYNYMEQNPQCGACQPKILSYTSPAMFEYAGASGGYLDRNGYPYCRGRIFSTIETDRGQYDSIATDLDWASGAALMIRTHIYNNAGGLDERFFAHMEEIDLCWRIRRAGFYLAAVPQSVVRHLGGGSLPASNPRKTYLNFRNNLLLLHKNLPDTERRGALIRRRLLDTIAWGMFVVTLQWGNAGAVLRAHNDYRRMARQYVSTHPTSNLLHGRPNILLEFYLKGKKQFSRL